MRDGALHNGQLRLTDHQPSVIPDLIRDPASSSARQEEAGPRIKSGATKVG